MGAYLSEPVTEKLSSDETKGSVQCGASCMQGWRINQEDAHNTLLDFDEDTMLFAVYDGHGGAEVASYSSQKLPDYIKNTEAYKSGNLVKALEDAFLGFDAHIATEEVMEELKKIAGQLNPPADDMGHSSEDEENMSTLYQDAQLPLREVLAKYTGEAGGCAAALRAKLADGSVPLSPCLRGKKDKEPNFDEAGASSSSGAGCSSAEAGCSGDAGGAASIKSEADVSSSTNSAGHGDKALNGEVTTSDIKTNDVKTKEPADSVPDSSEDNQEEPEQSETESGKKEMSNGDVTEGKAAENSITSSQNGEGKSAKGKSLDKSGSVSSSEAPASPAALRRQKMVPRRAAADLFKSLLNACPHEDDDSDSNDETFQGARADSSSDEELVNGANESSEEESESSDESEAEEGEEEGSSDEEVVGGGLEEPGNDSGCTAVVALLRGNQLYVGNAGDSRCIVCREGVAVDMSIDHKPEDAPELERITTAGGKVSQDGRINGGLNLSRALGDHSYKQNKDLDAKQQMITALPDVKTLTIDPEKDEFLMLACDGIWNFMSSQDVCDFVLPRLKEGREKLSQICEEMFDHCLAPNTMGDGTGCDNMTAVLVTWGGPDKARVAASASGKRGPDTDAHTGAKRHKPDDSCSVSSSV